MSENILLTNALQVRYMKFRFRLQMLEEKELPQNKPSAIRGGIGEMLLQANCIGNRVCADCGWKRDCIIQRTMYTSFEHKPGFVTSGDSIGYVVECDNYETRFKAGDTFTFNLLLFGSNIVYFNLYLQAVAALGQHGLGRELAKYAVIGIANTKGEDILQGNDIYLSQVQPETIADYVRFRKKELERESTGEQMRRKTAEGCGSAEMVFHTAATLKYHGKFLREFNPEAIVTAIQRRVYLLDCFEQVDEEEFFHYPFSLPVMEEQSVRPVGVRRYSNRKEQAMWMNGIKGSIKLTGLTSDTMDLLLAGELIHIGKNTSFGFGKYRVKNRESHDLITNRETERN